MVEIVDVNMGIVTVEVVDGGGTSIVVPTYVPEATMIATMITTPREIPGLFETLTLVLSPNLISCLLILCFCRENPRTQPLLTSI